MAKIDKSNILERLVPVLLVLTIGLAFGVGVLWQKVSQLEGGGTRVSNSATDQQAQGNQPPNGKLSEEQAEKLEPVGEGDYVRGSRDAEVFIVEYSDLQCPYCQRFHGTAQQAVDEYEGRVAWVYRHFPLDTIHPQARPAANAAECVGDLGGNDAFWNFIDYVFDNQSTALSDSGYVDAAQEVGVSSSDFQSCYDETRFSENVENDYDSGTTAGVTGTPGNFIVNSKGEVWLLPGAVPYSNLEQVIEEALAS